MRFLLTTVSIHAIHSDTMRYRGAGASYWLLREHTRTNGRMVYWCMVVWRNWEQMECQVWSKDIEKFLVVSAVLCVSETKTSNGVMSVMT